MSVEYSLGKYHSTYCNLRIIDINFFPICFRLKQKSHSAYLVENRIRVIKRRLALAMYTKRTTDWPRLLRAVTRNVNKNHVGSLGMKHFFQFFQFFIYLTQYKKN